MQEQRQTIYTSHEERGGLRPHGGLSGNAPDAGAVPACAVWRGDHGGAAAAFFQTSREVTMIADEQRHFLRVVEACSKNRTVFPSDKRKKSRNLTVSGLFWSECRDSNSRPLEPHSSAIPNFATPGYAAYLSDSLIIIAQFLLHCNP